MLLMPKILFPLGPILTASPFKQSLYGLQNDNLLIRKRGRKFVISLNTLSEKSRQQAIAFSDRDQKKMFDRASRQAELAHKLGSSEAGRQLQNNSSNARSFLSTPVGKVEEQCFIKE